MSVLQKEFELKTGIKKSDFTDDQEYYMALLQSISDKGEDAYNQLSAEGQSWFNDNVDLVTEEKDLKGFESFDLKVPEEITQEVEFGEDDSDTNKSKPNNAKNGGDRNVDIGEIREGFLVTIETSDDDVVEGTVVKVMKAAIKVEVDGKEVRISNRKIEKITIVSDSTSEGNDIENEASVSDENDKSDDEDSSNVVNVSKTAIKVQVDDKKLKEDVVEKIGIIEKIDTETLEKEQKTCCKSNKSSNTKQILFHVAEIIRLASEEM